MDSLDEYDPTLPLDLNSTSINITRLHDASSVGETSTMSDPGHAQASSANLMTTMSEGRMSPGGNRSMRDYATQISELKKENFSLKLRIFYMEERMQQQFTGDHEHIFQSNIELKVECDSLRKELLDKHDLLIKASNAVACIETGPEEVRRAHEIAQKELQQVKDAMHEKVQEADKELRAVRAEADSLAENVQKLQGYVEKLENDNENLKKDLEDANNEIETVKDSLQNEEEPESESTTSSEELNLLKEDIQKKEKLIEQLRETLEVKQTMVEALSDEKTIEHENLQGCKAAIDNLEEKNKDLDKELSNTKQQDERLRSEYMQHISEQQQRLDEFEIAARQMSDELEKREEEVRDLTEALKDAEETGKELADNYDKLQNEKEGKKTKELLMRDKAITGLTEVIRKKDEEIKKLKTNISRRESRFEELTNTISTLNTQEDTLDENLKRLRELERELQQMKNLNMDLEIKNQKLCSQLENSEELVRTLDENLKEKDEKLQELLNKYKELLKKQQEDELALTKADKEHKHMAKQFDQEKKEFADLMQNTRRQYEDSTKDVEEHSRSQENDRLQEKIQTLESHLRSKHLQLEEATSLFKQAECDRKSALDELEAAMRRRDEEQHREMESRNRINATKSSEIERLREEVRLKEDRLQNLEDELLQLDRAAHEARDKAVLSGREAARWKDDSSRKDSIIAELTEGLEALGNNVSNSDQKQLIKLTRENVELKQLLRAREAELSFLQNEKSTDDPYIESLKREIARKDKIIADERSKLSEDSSSMNSIVDSLRIEIENHKKELNKAKTMISTLTIELESCHQQILELHKTCDDKDRTIEDLKAAHRYPIIESEEGSSTSPEKKQGRSSERKHRLTKRKQRHRKDDNLSFLSSSTNTAQRFHTDDDNFSLKSSERDGFSGRNHGTRLKEELKNEIHELHMEIESLKGVHRDEINVQELLHKIELQKQQLRRLADILSEEQKLYRKHLNVSSRTSITSQSESEDGSDSVKLKRRLDRKLRQVDELRNQLKTLLLDVAHDEDVSIQVNSDLQQSVESSILPLNQTSYMEMPVPNTSSHTMNDKQENIISELKAELERTRAELGDVVRELADLQSNAFSVNQLKDQLDGKLNEISKLKQELDDIARESGVKDSEMSSLRIEVDRLRSLHLNVNNNDSGTDTARSVHSGEESDGMGSLSRKELREFISNFRKKLDNAEKLNELLRNQIETATKKQVSESGSIDPNLTKYLSNEVERLKDQLKNTQQELDQANKQTNIKPEETVRKSRSTSKSKLPVPVTSGKISPMTREPLSQSPSKDSKNENSELKAQCAGLQNKLAATEETVRQQTDKLKRAKAAMASAGISDPLMSPVRAARSHPNLCTDRIADAGSTMNHDTRPNGSDTHTQTSADDTGYASISLKSEQTYNSLIQAQAKELSALRQQLKKSREICKDLRTEYDIVLRYITSLLKSAAGQSDAMLASSVTNELDRCKQLTRRLKEQLSEWTSDGGLSSDSDESTTSSRKNISLAQRQATQLIQKNQDLDQKNQQIRLLEDRVADLLRVKHDIDTQTQFYKQPKGQKISLENFGFLTPSSSRHSIYNNMEEEVSATSLRATISQNTEYVPLPDLRSPRLRPTEESFTYSPRSDKSMPMYQRTIAVTEYLPSADNDGLDGGRRQLPNTSNGENCTTSYGGSWGSTASPRKQNENNSRLSFLPDSIADHSSPTNENDREINNLKRKLKDSRRLNESLKEELDLTADASREAKRLSNISQTGSNRSPADILDEHLSEIRTLRQHLENSIATNDRLREQLQRKLEDARKNGPAGTDHVSANIYLPAEADAVEMYEEEIDGLREKLARSNEEKSKLQNQLEAEISMNNNFNATSKELEQLRMRLVESSTQTELLGGYIDGLNSAIAEKEIENEKLQNQLLEQDDELKKLKDEKEIFDIETNSLRHENGTSKESINRMKEDMNRLNEEVDEGHHLVRSLKSELALYEKYHKNKGLSDGRSPQKTSSLQDSQILGLDISEFLAEIKSLRVQLERSIDANAALRKQLQQQLRCKDNMSTPTKTTTINIHHLPPGHNENDVFDGKSPTDSARNSSRKKLKMNQDDNQESFLMTPPPSASSCGEELSLSGFEFAPLPHVTSASKRRNAKQQNCPLYDLDGPYIIGRLSDYTELKQVITDGRLLVRNMEIRSSNKVIPSVLSPSKGPRKTRSSKDFDENIRLLHKMMEESGRILKLFWPASIPPPPLQLPSTGVSERGCQKCASVSRQSEASSDASKCTRDAGFASDSSINSEADGLRREVGKLHKRLSAQDKLLKNTVDRLQNANRMKEGIEHAILKQLSVTHDVLRKARGNLEAKSNDIHSKESSFHT